MSVENYYSPIPDVEKLPPRTWSHEFPVFTSLFDLGDMLEFARRLGHWTHEMLDTPLAESEPGRYFYGNGQFPDADALAYHAIIREFRPRRIVEVGAGYSSMVASNAATANGNGCFVTCIEPYPIEPLRRGWPGLSELIASPVQDVPVDFFKRLNANDILFIDSSHVSKIGSDVNYLILDVLPQLSRGVLIHFHDIFLPWYLPRAWIQDLGRYWNEQYLVLAFLIGNADFRPLLANHYLRIRYPEQFAAAFPGPDRNGGSLWIRRVA
jgi:hypothetical protein